MTLKAHAQSTAAIPALWKNVPVTPWPTPAANLEERLKRIEAMGQRIDGYVQFICKVGSLNGTSAEAKERAVTAFYERMVVVENQLCRIQEILRLE